MFKKILEFLRKLKPKVKSAAFTGSLDEVLDYAILSSDAYDKKESLKTKYPDCRIKDLKDSEVQYILMPGKIVQTIAVRGTSNLRNARVDAHYTKDKDKRLGIYLHSGFNRAAEELYQDIKSHLDKAKKIHITGHSLGGAIAVILAMYLKKRKFKVRKVITFGQPKVTNHKGMWKFKRLPLLRVVHDNDPVPHVPPISFVTAAHGIYEHLGAELVLRDDDKEPLYFDRHTAQAKDVGEFWLNIDKLEVDDHFMKNYIKAIREAKSGV